MRTTAVNGEGKGKQRAAETPESHPNSSSAPISASKAVRPATLSPDTARVGDTHTRTSRFLRKSRSKQHLRDSDKRGGSDNDEGVYAFAFARSCCEAS